MHLRRSVVVLVMLAALGGGVASGQTGGARRQWYAELSTGPVFADPASLSISGESGYRLTRRLDVFIEGGRMRSVETKDLAHARSLIAEYLSSAAAGPVAFAGADPASHVDVGIAYRFRLLGRWTPTAGVGVGAASLSHRATLMVDGLDQTDQLLNTYGVQLGPDLSGSSRRPFVTLRGGTMFALTAGWFTDIRVQESEIFTDRTVHVHRLQLGFGRRF